MDLVRRYSAASLRDLRSSSGLIDRVTRKVLFSYRIWNIDHPRRISVIVRRGATLHEHLSKSKTCRAQRSIIHIDTSAHDFGCVRSEKRLVSFGCINAQSMNKKSIIIQNLIVDRKLDVLAITETWHEGLDSFSLRRAAPVGYKCIDVPRPILPNSNVDSSNFVNHGGVAIICR